MIEALPTFPDTAISSLSASPADARKPWQVRFASRETARNSARLVQALRDSFGDSTVSVSLLAGRNINSRRLVKHLAKNEVQVSSVDVPEIVPFGQLVRSVKDSLKKKDGRLANHLGWYISNTGSESQQLRKVKKALQATGAKMIHTNAGFWREGNHGQKLEAFLEEYARRHKIDSIALAIEIDSEHQSPDEYLAFFKAKRQKLLDRKSPLSAVMDIDLGHIAQWYVEPVSFLQRVYDDPELRETLAVVSFNQHIRGEAEAHAQLDAPGGVVNFENAATFLGSTGERVRIIFEPNPKERPAFVNTIHEGLAHRLREAYSRGRDSRSA